MDLTIWLNENLSAISAVIIYLLVSSAVQALPEPNTNDPKIYQWLYRFSHAVVANWKPAIKQIETKEIQEEKKEITKGKPPSIATVVRRAEEQAEITGAGGPTVIVLDEKK